MNYIETLKDYCNKEKEIINDLDLNEINTVMNVLDEARQNNKNIFICGNGGSAATASHFCCDFNKGANSGAELVPPFHFESLNDNIPTMLAIANDIGYDEVFRFQLKTRMKPGDILIGISGSGNSQNIVNAFQYANEAGGISIAITGYDGGKIKMMSNYSIHVKVNNMQITEDVHMILDHMMMYVFVYHHRQERFRKEGLV